MYSKQYLLSDWGPCLMAPVLGIWASSFNSRSFTPTGSYDALATYTVPSGGVSSITFAGIPTSGQYQHLQLRVMAASNYAGPDTDDLSFQFNGDTSSSYAGQGFGGNGSSASAGYNPAASNNRSLRVGANNGSTFGAGYIDFLDFASTAKYKIGRSLGGVDWNGGGAITLESLLWLKTSAINSMTIVPRYGTAWLQHSQFSLYGVK
jgi:hypothetical protein